MFELIICVVGYILQIMGVLISVAFFTLYERKLLSYSQYRVGPNKVSFMGLLQPMADAMKLFTKERMMPFKSIKVVYLLSPVFTLFFPMFIWLLQPFWFSGLEYKFAWMLMFCGCSFNVYFGFLSGWVSNSKYSIMGSFRAVSQMISYEVALAFMVIFYSLYICSYNLNSFDEKSMLLLFYPFGMMWFIICLSESQRTPFDLAEGESELVSGFNTEYSASNFALLFLGEYMSMLFMCMLSTVLVFGYTLKSVQFVMLLTIFFTLFIWARCTFPRIRYDCLMLYLWKGVLPALILMFLMLFLYNFVI